MQDFVTKQLLQAYFAGRASSEQREKVREWAKEPAHQESFYQCLHEWESRHHCYLADVSLARAKFKARLLGWSSPGSRGKGGSPDEDAHP